MSFGVCWQTLRGTDINRAELGGAPGLVVHLFRGGVTGVDGTGWARGWVVALFTAQVPLGAGARVCPPTREGILTDAVLIMHTLMVRL